MATPAFRSAGTASEVNTTTTSSVGYTLTAGDLLLVTIELSAATTPAITSAKWNTTETMTLVGSVVNSVFRSNHTYGLMGATSGTHNVDIVADRTCNVIAATAFGYMNVDSGTPWDTAATAQAFNTTPTVTANGATGDLVVTTALASENYAPLTMTNGTKRDEQVTANVSLIVIDQASAASVTTNGTYNVNNPWTWVSFNLNASAATEPVGRLLEMNQAVKRASYF